MGKSWREEILEPLNLALLAASGKFGIDLGELLILNFCRRK